MGRPFSVALDVAGGSRRAYLMRALSSPASSSRPTP